MTTQQLPWQTKRGRAAYKQILAEIEQVKNEPGRAGKVAFFRAVLRTVEKRLGGDFDGTQPLTDEEMEALGEARIKAFEIPELRLEEGRKMGYFPPTDGKELRAAERKGGRRMRL